MNPTELKHFVAMFREKKRNVLLVAFSNFIFSSIVFKFLIIITSFTVEITNNMVKKYSHVFFSKLLTEAVVKIFAGT